MFNTQKTKVNNLEKKIPDATTLIYINQYDTDKQNLEETLEMIKKIPDTSGLVTSTVLNTKISEVENKKPDHVKFITSQEFNKLTTEKFAERLSQVKLVRKTGFDNKLISFNRKITSNKTEHLEVIKKLISLTTKDNFPLNRMYFTSNDGPQNTFVYQTTLDTLELKKKQRY